MCGGDIHAETGANFGNCAHCGKSQVIPITSGSRTLNIFNLANRHLYAYNFDTARSLYEQILMEDATNAEALWSLVLCDYGIEYVPDPATGKNIITCHRTQHESIFSNPDYLAAIEHAPNTHVKNHYQEEAKIIDQINKEIMAIANKEAPYDVFICYKETDPKGQRTPDSVMAQELYDQITNAGFKVFYAPVSLENRLGQNYEPYIFSAINTAQVMLAIGTKKEYFEAPWVKNEWSRFHNLIEKDKSRTRLLIPCYRYMDVYSLPELFLSKRLQSQDLEKLGATHDLIRNIKKIIQGDEPMMQHPGQAGHIYSGPGIDSLLKRGQLFLEDEDWHQANEYFNKVLDIDPEHAPAYIGKLYVDLRCNSERKLAECSKTFESNPNYQKAIRFANEEAKARLQSHNRQIEERNDNHFTGLVQQYNELIGINKPSPDNFTTMSDQYLALWNEFRAMDGYIIASKYADSCYSQHQLLVAQRDSHIQKQHERQKAWGNVRTFFRFIAFIAAALAIVATLIYYDTYVISEDEIMMRIALSFIPFLLLLFIRVNGRAWRSILKILIFVVSVGLAILLHLYSGEMGVIVLLNLISYTLPVIFLHAGDSGYKFK